jgi:hypothetical protein
VIELGLILMNADVGSLINAWAVQILFTPSWQFLDLDQVGLIFACNDSLENDTKAKLSKK